MTLKSTEPLEAHASKGSYEERKRFQVKHSKTPEFHRKIEEGQPPVFVPLTFGTRTLPLKFAGTVDRLPELLG